MPTQATACKAITICQPWAWAIAAGHKLVENRSWRTSYRGLLAIHAGQSLKQESAGRELLASLSIECPEDLPRGAIVATCQLLDCIEFAGHADCQTTAGHWLRSDPFATGPYCWLLADVQQLARPITARGNQRLWPINLDERQDHEQSPPGVSSRRATNLSIDGTDRLNQSGAHAKESITPRSLDETSTWPTSWQQPPT